MLVCTRKELFRLFSVIAIHGHVVSWKTCLETIHVLCISCSNKTTVTTTSVGMACAVLHNFLRRSETSRSCYSYLGTFDSEEDGKLLSIVFTPSESAKKTKR